MKFEIPTKVELVINYSMEAESQEEAIEKVREEVEKFKNALKCEGICDNIDIHMDDSYSKN
jgi:hypothetical protein